MIADASHLQLWQSVVLGLVEGITEYLPVSSTGHLILASAWMKLNQTDEQRRAVNDFNVVIQSGAIAAVLGLYWPSVLRMLKGLLGRDEPGLRLLLNLVIAFIPAAVLGLLFGDLIDKYLFQEGPVLFALGAGAIYMMIVDLRSQRRMGRLPSFGPGPDVFDITPRQALLIGCLQCVALWPGTSRSMMTITGAIFAGLRPPQAAKFSFLLGLPTLIAATGYKLAKNFYRSHKEHTPNMLDTLGAGACLVGILVAAVSAAIAVKWLVSFLSRHGLTPFGWYRLALCAVIAAMVIGGAITIDPPPARTIRNETRTVEPLQWNPATPPTPATRR